MNDLDLIMQQNDMKKKNHPYSEISKCPKGTQPPLIDISVGDLVYLYQDKHKHRARDRYLVVSLDGVWCNIRKFTGSQLRQTSYRIKRDECYKVPNTIKENIFKPPEEHCEMEYNTPSESQCLPNDLTNSSESIPPQRQQVRPQHKSSNSSNDQVPEHQCNMELESILNNSEVPRPLTPPPVPPPPLPDIPEEISPSESQGDNSCASQLQEPSLMDRVTPSTDVSTRPRRERKTPVTLKDYHLY